MTASMDQTNRGGARAIAVGIAAAVLFVIVCMGIGYLRAGSRDGWGEAVQIDLGRWEFTGTTPRATAAGLQPGDIVDTRSWSLRQRLAFTFVPVGAAFTFPVERAGRQLVLRHEAGVSPAEHDGTRAADVFFRLLLLVSGLLIIIRGRGRAALAAGLFLACFAAADSPVMTFAGLAEPVQVAALLLAHLARLAAYAFAFTFAVDLLPKSPLWKTRAIAAFLVLFIGLVFARAEGMMIVLAGYAWPALPHFALPIAQLAIRAYLMAIFAIAAVMASREHAFAVRIIFWATLFTTLSYLIQQCFLLLRAAPPAWMFWYFNTALAGVAIGYPWAILARRLAAVDFVVSRTAVYVIAISLVVGVISLTETLVGQLAVGFVGGKVLEYGVPLALGLSFNAIQNEIGRLLKRVLYRDRMRAEQRLNALLEDFPSARDFDMLAARVVREIAETLHAARATVYDDANAEYKPVATAPASQLLVPGADDPAFLRLRATGRPVDPAGMDSVLTDGLLFPLVIFGRVLGALHCGRRVHGEAYDAAERRLLAGVARELASALLFLRHADALRPPVMETDFQPAIGTAAPVSGRLAALLAPGLGDKRPG